MDSIYNFFPVLSITETKKALKLFVMEKMKHVKTSRPMLAVVATQIICLTDKMDTGAVVICSKTMVTMTMNRAMMIGRRTIQATMMMKMMMNQKKGVAANNRVKVMPAVLILI